MLHAPRGLRVAPAVRPDGVSIPRGCRCQSHILAIASNPDPCHQPPAAAVEGVTRRKGDASAAGAAPLRSDGGLFLAAAGGAGLRFWPARRLARGCGGLDRLVVVRAGRAGAVGSGGGALLLDGDSGGFWRGMAAAPGALGGAECWGFKVGLGVLVGSP